MSVEIDVAMRMDAGSTPAGSIIKEVLKGFKEHEKDHKRYRNGVCGLFLFRWKYLKKLKKLKVCTPPAHLFIIHLALVTL